MSVWKNRPDGKTVRRNKIAQQFAWLSVEALNSPAYRALSLSGHRVLARIQIEHARHGGQENGKLPVTFRDFHSYGIHPGAVAPAIRETEALGFIRVTQHGIPSNAEFRIPNKFALTHLPTKIDSGEAAPTDDWRKIKSLEEATTIAAAARAAPARYRRFPRKNRPTKKTGLRYGNRIKPGYGNRTKTTQKLDTETVSLSATETVSLSISAVGAAAAAVEPSGLLTWSTPTLTELSWNANWQRLYCEVMETPGIGHNGASKLRQNLSISRSGQPVED